MISLHPDASTMERWNLLVSENLVTLFYLASLLSLPWLLPALRHYLNRWRMYRRCQQYPQIVVQSKSNVHRTQTKWWWRLWLPFRFVLYLSLWFLGISLNRFSICMAWLWNHLVNAWTKSKAWIRHQVSSMRARRVATPTAPKPQHRVAFLQHSNGDVQTQRYYFDPQAEPGCRVPVEPSITPPKAKPEATPRTKQRVSRIHDRVQTPPRRSIRQRRHAPISAPAVVPTKIPPAANSNDNTSFRDRTNHDVPTNDAKRLQLAATALYQQRGGRGLFTNTTNLPARTSAAQTKSARTLIAPTPLSQKFQKRRLEGETQPVSKRPAWPSDKRVPLVTTTRRHHLHSSYRSLNKRERQEREELLLKEMNRKQKIPKVAIKESTTTAAPVIAFGATKTPTGATPSVSFGATTTPSNSNKPVFSFGASTPTTPAAGAPATDTVAPTFGTPGPAGSTPAAKPAISFGATTTPTAAPGTPAETSTKPTVTFGATTIAAAPAAGTSTPAPANKPTVTFGATTVMPPGGTPAPSSGSASTKPSVSFGATTVAGPAGTPSFGATTTPTASKPTVTFGATTAVAPPGGTPGPSFGATTTPTASKPAISFGATTTTAAPTFGATTPATANPSVSFGGAAPAAPGAPGFSFPTSSSAPSFGAVPPAPGGASERRRRARSSRRRQG